MQLRQLERYKLPNDIEVDSYLSCVSSYFESFKNSDLYNPLELKLCYVCFRKEEHKEDNNEAEKKQSNN